MPIITGSNHQFVFSKKSNTMFSGAAAASITVTHVPPTGGSYLKVTVSGGTSNTGTVTINGTLATVARSDVLTYTGTHWYITANQYDAITSVITSGLADETTKPTIKIESCDASGVPKTWSTNYTYYGTFRQPEARREMLRINAEGLNAPTFYEAIIDMDVDVAMGDLFTVTGQTGTFAVWSNPNRKFFIGTDLVASVQFFATLKSTT